MGKMLLHLATATRWFLEASINVLEISSKALINSIAIFAYGLLSLSLSVPRNKQSNNEEILQQSQVKLNQPNPNQQFHDQKQSREP